MEVQVLFPSFIILIAATFLNKLEKRLRIPVPGPVFQSQLSLAENNIRAMMCFCGHPCQSPHQSRMKTSYLKSLFCLDEISYAKGSNLLGRMFLQLTRPAALRNQLWHNSLNQGLPEELFYHDTSCHLPRSHMSHACSSSTRSSQAWSGPDVLGSHKTSAMQAQLAVL